jgi:hypothetical protein
MTCMSCRSDNQAEFNSEINIHFPGLKGVDRPTVWVFPKLAVCLNCGLAEFVICKTELLQLSQIDDLRSA